MPRGKLKKATSHLGRTQGFHTYRIITSNASLPDTCYGQLEIYVTGLLPGAWEHVTLHGEGELRLQVD